MPDISRALTLSEAREFFRHPSQQLYGITPDTLPREGFEYWAAGPVCIAFCRSMWPGVWSVHIGVKPEAWGRFVPFARRVLEGFAAVTDVRRYVAWLPASNRQAISAAKRCGAKEDGRMPLKDETIVMLGMSWV